MASTSIQMAETIHCLVSRISDEMEQKRGDIRESPRVIKRQISKIETPSTISDQAIRDNNNEIEATEESDKQIESSGK